MLSVFSSKVSGYKITFFYMHLTHCRNLFRKHYHHLNLPHCKEILPLNITTFSGRQVTWNGQIYKVSQYYEFFYTHDGTSTQRFLKSFTDAKVWRVEINEQLVNFQTFDKRVESGIIGCLNIYHSWSLRLLNHLASKRLNSRKQNSYAL